ncbi:MAG: hypothetical protein LRY56_00300 [Burkholderiaceae bacterium]|nr:hypothetical protein [Burkholderiaceae bacterium]
MSWRLLFVFVVVLLGASAAAGVGLGNWLVDQAPTISAEARTNTTRPPEIILDAAGRPLAAIPPTAVARWFSGPAPRRNPAFVGSSGRIPV